MEANYSVHTVRAVEQGREPPSPAFIATVARVLRCEPEQLTGAPYHETLDEDGPLEGLTDLRSILTEGRYVRPMEPGPVGALSAEIDAVNLVYRNDGGRDALARLPVLLRRLYGAARNAKTDSERAQIHSLLFTAHVAAERIAREFGYLALCIPLLDRLDELAPLADDPYLSSQAKVKRARALMYLDSTDISQILIESALDDIPGKGETPAVVRGYAHLCGAIAAARGRKPDLAHDHITEARKLAQLVKGESELYGTRFGRVNTEFHACAVELESGDPEKAARDGSRLAIPANVAPHRVGHHWHDTARAWLLSGQPSKALDALNRARRAAPQQTRLHPSVRETLTGIAEMERRRSDTLASFAGWVGMKI